MSLCPFPTTVTITPQSLRISFLWFNLLRHGFRDTCIFCVCLFIVNDHLNFFGFYSVYQKWKFFKIVFGVNSIFGYWFLNILCTSLIVAFKNKKYSSKCIFRYNKITFSYCYRFFSSDFFQIYLEIRESAGGMCWCHFEYYIYINIYMYIYTYI